MFGTHCSILDQNLCEFIWHYRLHGRPTLETVLVGTANFGTPAPMSTDEIDNFMIFIGLIFNSKLHFLGSIIKITFNLVKESYIQRYMLSIIEVSRLFESETEGWYNL